MSVTIKDVEHIAALARLEFSEAEKQKFTSQLNTILEYVDQLNKLNTDNVEPLAQMVDAVNIVRPDQVKPALDPEQVMRNAPSKTETFFKVPKVIGE
jgi:aspartyl-tRNA(Asn)/glutamyl-tRNA(Gln) amidotransferase subunit C